MEASIEWIENRRSVRFILTTLGLLAAFSMGTVAAVGLLVGSTPLVILPALVVLAIVCVIGFLISQPLRIGFRGEEILFHQPYGTRRVATYRVSEARFTLPARHADRPDSERMYSLRLVMVGGLVLDVGNLDGPIAARIMGRMGPEKVRLWIASRDRVVEFQRRDGP